MNKMHCSTKALIILTVAVTVFTCTVWGAAGWEFIMEFADVARQLP